MHSCDAAKDVRIADEGSEEVHSVHSHMPWRRRLHHSRIISLVKPHKDPLPAYTLLLQPAQHPAQYARTNLQHISCAFTSCLRPRCSIRAPACMPYSSRLWAVTLCVCEHSAVPVKPGRQLKKLWLHQLS